MKFQNNYDVVVIGGGASGMMAAAVAGARGKRLLLLEQNRLLGEKLRISGGGRCNITNAEFDTRALLTHYGDAEQFLYAPFAQFGVQDTIDYFAELRLPIVVQAKKRAFPESERAEDVCGVLEKELRKHNVHVATASAVARVMHKGDRITGVVVGDTVYTAESYILATGGVSHPETGSTGDGFGWLKSLGHSVHDPTPSIVPLATREKWSHALAGTTLKDVKVTFFVDEIRQLQVRGDILMTHFGLSGPTILNAATKVAGILEQGEVTATIDCFPSRDAGALDRHIVTIFDTNKNKQLKNVMRHIAPSGTAAVFLSQQSSVDPEQEVHSVSKLDRKALVNYLKAVPLTIAGLMGHDRAVVADGGVSLNEIDTKTMRSNKVYNLYITGDLLHINRPSAGYSLQLCWTTGYVAGAHA